jgi:uncharacterized protein (DUF697 family)/GTP-binding protein EngB required for normal cell division
MTRSLRPWILIGLGAVASLWLLDGITDLLSSWFPAIVIGSGITWVLLKAEAPPTRPLSSQPLTLATVQSAVAEAEEVVNQLAAEVEEQANEGSRHQVASLRYQIHQLLQALERDEIRVAVLGGSQVGKTSLVQWLQLQWASTISQQLQLMDTPALFQATDTAELAETQAWHLAKAADVVLFVTESDVTASQLQVIRRLVAAHRRALLVFNKQDQYLPKEQTQVLQVLRERVQGLLQPQDVLAISTQPRPMKVRQYQGDGSVQEWIEEPEPQLAALTERLNTILLQEGQKLIFASSVGNAAVLKADAQAKLNAARRERALPLIEKAQWIVAGTAFANPFPALDLLATAAINGQLVLELGQLYQQKLNLTQAKTVATTLATLMVKLGVVEASTQAIAALLKSNAFTYIAGGVAQGVSAAYLTRLAGLTLAEYWENVPAQRLQPDKLQHILQRVFQQNQRGEVLKMFVQQAVERVTASQPALSAAAIASLPTSSAQPLPELLPLSQPAVAPPTRSLDLQPQELP